MLKKFLLSLCTCLILTGCQSGSSQKIAESEELEKYSTQLFAMDTVMDISIYAPDDTLLIDASELVDDLNNNLSTTYENSEIYQLNHTGSAVLSAKTSQLFDKALNFCKKTDGALDLSIYPIVRAWGFTTDTYQVPSQQELDELLANVDYTKIKYSSEDNTVSLPDGMEVDLGSVAKGYTGDQLISLFKENNISSALLNLGGNVQALGNKPDGSLWRVGIQDPVSENYMGVLSISDQAVITSGGYERYFTDENGTMYWHIIDPFTGYPAKNGICSATAIGPEGAYCDALSTALFVMGKKKAIDFWRENQDFEMILLTDEGEVLISPGLTDSFQLMEESPYTLAVIPND